MTSRGLSFVPSAEERKTRGEPRKLTAHNQEMCPRPGCFPEHTLLEADPGACVFVGLQPLPWTAENTLNGTGSSRRRGRLRGRQSPRRAVASLFPT